jgi:ATP-dependent DNA helicase DinG
MKPSDLDLVVPGDAWRPGQWEIIQRIALSPKRFVLFEGPPGSGKSLVARSVAKLLDFRRTHYLTGTIQLQEQYESDGVTRAVGRPNFQCGIEPVGADAAICTVGGKCVHAGPRGASGCDYFDQKRAAAGAREAVFNYAYWLRQVNYAGFPKPNFIVADEAHTLKDHVRSFAEVSVLRSALGKVGIRKTPDGDDWPEWHRWAVAHFPYVKKRYVETLKDPPSEGEPEKIRHFRSIHALYQSVMMLSAQPDDAEWIVQSNPYGWSFKPIWVHHFVPQLALNHAASKVLLMSATILNREVFTQLHGLPTNDVEFIQEPSRFSVHQRPLYYSPVERGKRGADQSATIAGVAAILGRHPTDRVVVHTVSNWLAREIAEGVRLRPESVGRAILTHGSGDRIRVLQLFRDTPGAVLISPSMHTGVDLPDDLLRVQIIVRLPFPDLGDPLIKAQMKNATRDNPLDKGNRAYTYDTAATLVQTYGRIMRSADDYGTTYLLDPAWKWFRYAARDFLPEWFVRSITYQPADAPRAKTVVTDPERFLDNLLVH